MRIFLLALGTFFALVFIVKLKKGKKYEQYVNVLDESAFPLHDLYVAGYALSESKMFSLRGSLAKNLKQEATILYEQQYSDYYASVAWAQALTFSIILPAFTFLLAGIMYSMAGLLILFGIFLTVLTIVYSLQNMKNELSKRTEECSQELPEVVSTLAVLVNSGMVLREAWKLISETNTGAFYDLMKKSVVDMNNGLSDADAIFLFGKRSNSVEIKKFTTALIQSLEKGGAELSVFLANQSSELWQAKRQKMLQMGEKAATKLLMPIVLIFVGILIIVLTAAFAGALF